MTFELVWHGSELPISIYMMCLKKVNGICYNTGKVTSVDCNDSVIKTCMHYYK